MNKRYYEHTLSTTREFIEYLQKFKETGKEINISNLDINRVLTKKEHNEIRRGIQHT